MLPYGYHIKKSDTSINMEEPQPHDRQNRIIKPSDYRYTKSDTSINMEEPQPHDSQNRIIKPSDYRYTTTPIPIIRSFPLI